MKTIAILLIVAVSANAQLQDYRLLLNITASEPKDCTVAGPFCETCTSLVDCMRNSDGSYTKIAVGQCVSPSKCVKGACTADPDPFCDGTADLPFLCENVGTFPDPFYCNKFVMCVADPQNPENPLSAFLNECDEGYGFDVGTGVCSVKLTKKTCTQGIYPVPLCTKLGQMGALAKKPSEYYVCTQREVTVNGAKQNVIYPVLYQCPHGNSFNNYGCGI